MASSKIIPFINEKLDSLSYLDTIHGLAERIQKDDKVYPAEYVGKGEYQKIKMRNALYHRKTGNVGVEEAESTTGCGTSVQQTFPYRMVAFVDKSRIDNCDQYTDEDIANDLVRVITASGSSLKTSLKADQVEIIPTEIGTDRYEIWGEETDGLDMEIGFKHALVAINYEVKVTAPVSCFEELCS